MAKCHSCDRLSVWSAETAALLIGGPNNKPVNKCCEWYFVFAGCLCGFAYSMHIVHRKRTKDNAIYLRDSKIFLSVPEHWFWTCSYKTHSCIMFVHFLWHVKSFFHPGHLYDYCPFFPNGISKGHLPLGIWCNMRSYSNQTLSSIKLPTRFTATVRTHRIASVRAFFYCSMCLFLPCSIVRSVFSNVRVARNDHHEWDASHMALPIATEPNTPSIGDAFGCDRTNVCVCACVVFSFAYWFITGYVNRYEPFHAQMHTARKQCRPQIYNTAHHVHYWRCKQIFVCTVFDDDVVDACQMIDIVSLAVRNPNLHRIM